MGFRDVILTLGLAWLLDGIVVVVVASDVPSRRLVKPNGRGWDTAAIVVLLAEVLAKVLVAVVVVVVVDWLELLAGTVVSRISVAESSTSFTDSVVEPTVALTLGGLADGSTLITVTTSVEVDMVGGGATVVVDDEVVALAVTLDTSGYPSALAGEVILLVSCVNRAASGESSDTFEVVLLNLCILIYL